ncbi:MAG TPA: EcsC family protein [Mycobacteriales bacterium]|nr:EcsC family protein [Mycobacteriales bacterium]
MGNGDGVLTAWLGRAIDAGVDGVGPLKGARDLVDPLRRKGLSAEAIVDRLVKTQSGHAALQGAVTSAGGIATAAIGAPLGLAATLLVQARLAAAIAYAHGHDPATPDVRKRIEECVSGATDSTAAKRTGIATGRKAASYVLPRLQQRAAARAATRAAAGQSAGALTSRVAAVTGTRAVPVVGALVGGVFDLVSTRRVADRSRRAFAPGGLHGEVIDGELLAEN